MTLEFFRVVTTLEIFVTRARKRFDTFIVVDSNEAKERDSTAFADESCFALKIRQLCHLISVSFWVLYSASPDASCGERLADV